MFFQNFLDFLVYFALITTIPIPSYTHGRSRAPYLVFVIRISTDRDDACIHTPYFRRPIVYMYTIAWSLYIYYWSPEIR